LVYVEALHPEQEEDEDEDEDEAGHLRRPVMSLISFGRGAAAFYL